MVDRSRPPLSVSAIEIVKVCPMTTRDRRWTARTGFFVLYSDFKEHLATRSRRAHATTSSGGGGALRPHHRFDPEPDLPMGQPPT